MGFGALKVEISPTSKCICITCESTIEKGALRLVEKKGAGKWQKVLRYCTNCAKKRLEEIQAEVTRLMEGF